MSDLSAVAKLVGKELFDQFRESIEGEDEQLRAFGEAIALDALRGVAENRPELQREVAEQTKLLAEAGRLLLAGGLTWDQVAKWAIALARVALGSGLL